MKNFSGYVFLKSFTLWSCLAFAVAPHTRSRKYHMIKLRGIYPIVISGGDPCSPHHAGTSEAWDIESYRQALIPLDFARFSVSCCKLSAIGHMRAPARAPHGRRPFITNSSPASVHYRLPSRLARLHRQSRKHEREALVG